MLDTGATAKVPIYKRGNSAMPQNSLFVPGGGRRERSNTVSNDGELRERLMKSRSAVARTALGGESEPLSTRHLQPPHHQQLGIQTNTTAAATTTNNNIINNNAYTTATAATASSTRNHPPTDYFGSRLVPAPPRINVPADHILNNTPLRQNTTIRSMLLSQMVEEREAALFVSSQGLTDERLARKRAEQRISKLSLQLDDARRSLSQAELSKREHARAVAQETQERLEAANSRVRELESELAALKSESEGAARETARYRGRAESVMRSLEAKLAAEMELSSQLRSAAFASLDSSASFLVDSKNGGASTPASARAAMSVEAQLRDAQHKEVEAMAELKETKVALESMARALSKREDEVADLRAALSELQNNKTNNLEATRRGGATASHSGKGSENRDDDDMSVSELENRLSEQTDYITQLEEVAAEQAERLEELTVQLRRERGGSPTGYSPTRRGSPSRVSFSSSFIAAAEAEDAAEAKRKSPFPSFVTSPPSAATSRDYNPNASAISIGDLSLSKDGGEREGMRMSQLILSARKAMAFESQQAMRRGLEAEAEADILTAQLANEIEALQAENASLKERYDKLEVESVRLKFNLSDGEDSIALAREFESLKSASLNYQREVDDLTSECNRLREELGQAHAALDAAVAAAHAREATTSQSLSLRVSELEGKLAEAQTAVAAERSRADDVYAQYTSHLKESERSKVADAQQLAVSTQQIGALRQQVVALEAELMSYEARAGDGDMTVTRLQSKVDMLERQLEQANSAAQQSSADESTLSQLRTAKTDLESKVLRLERDIDNERATHSRLKAERDSQRRSFERQISEKEREIARLRAELDATGSQRDSVLHKRIKELEDRNRELEAAVDELAEGAVVWEEAYAELQAEADQAASEAAREQEELLNIAEEGERVIAELKQQLDTVQGR